MTLKFDSWLLEVLACPNCGGGLRADDAASRAGVHRLLRLAYPVRDDIPVLLVDEARTPAP